MEILTKENNTIILNTLGDLVRFIKDNKDNVDCLQPFLSYNNKIHRDILLLLSKFYKHKSLENYNNNKSLTLCYDCKLYAKELDITDNFLFNRFFSRTKVKKEYFTEDNLNFFRINKDSSGKIRVTGILLKDFKKVLYEHKISRILALKQALEYALTVSQIEDPYVTKYKCDLEQISIHNSTTLSIDVLKQRCYRKDDTSLVEIYNILLNNINEYYGKVTEIKDVVHNSEIFRFLGEMSQYYDNDSDIARYMSDTIPKLHKKLQTTTVSLESFIENTFNRKWVILKNLTKIAVKDYVKVDNHSDINDASDRFIPTYRALNERDNVIVSALNLQLSATNDKINELVSKLTSYFIEQSKDSPYIKIIQGVEIAKYYNVKNYTEPSGSLGSSCMRYGGVTNEHTEFYCINHEVCKLLVYLKNNKISARALLWYIDGKIYIDRIFDCDSNAARMMTVYANNHEFISIYNQSTYNVEYNLKHDGEGLFVKVKPVRTAMPYLDSMSRYDIANNLLYHQNSKTANGIFMNCHNAGGSHRSFIDEHKFNVTSALTGKYLESGNTIFLPDGNYIERHIYFTDEINTDLTILKQHYNISDSILDLMKKHMTTGSCNRYYGFSFCTLTAFTTDNIVFFTPKFIANNKKYAVYFQSSTSACKLTSTTDSTNVRELSWFIDQMKQRKYSLREIYDAKVYSCLDLYIYDLLYKSLVLEEEIPSIKIVCDLDCFVNKFFKRNS